MRCEDLLSVAVRTEYDLRYRGEPIKLLTRIPLIRRLLANRHRSVPRSEKWQVKMRRLLRSKPYVLLDRRYDRFAILAATLIWLPYTYVSPILTSLTHHDEFVTNSTYLWRWMPTLLIVAFFQVRISVLWFKTIADILVYCVVGFAAYFLYFAIAGFSIIDFAWFGFYYSGIGTLQFMRIRQRAAVSLIQEINANVSVFSLELIKELKSDWQLLLGRSLQLLVASVTVLGVCMSILLTATVPGKEGTPIFAWHDWNRVLNATRMTSLFLMIIAVFAIFLLVPLLEVVGSHQQLMMKRERAASRPDDA